MNKRGARQGKYFPAIGAPPENGACNRNKGDDNKHNLIEQRDPSPRPGSLLNWRESAGPGGQGVTAADRLSLALNHNQDGVTGALAHGDLILGGLIDHLVGGGGDRKSVV